MSMFEEARALAVTMKMRGFNQKEMARSLGVSPSYVANKLRLLSLSEEIQKDIIANGLSERHARALLRLKNERDRQKVLKEAIKSNLTVAETEELVDTCCRSGRIGNVQKTNLFLESLDTSIASLQKSGIITEKHMVCEKDKIMITICITKHFVNL